MRAPSEGLGTRHSRYGRRSLDDTEFRASAEGLLGHLDRWVPDDAPKEPITALWACTRNQRRR